MEPIYYKRKLYGTMTSAFFAERFCPISLPFIPFTLQRRIDEMAELQISQLGLSINLKKLK